MGKVEIFRNVEQERLPCMKREENGMRVNFVDVWGKSIPEKD